MEKFSRNFLFLENCVTENVFMINFYRKIAFLRKKCFGRKLLWQQKLFKEIVKKIFQENFFWENNFSRKFFLVNFFWENVSGEKCSKKFQGENFVFGTCSLGNFCFWKKFLSENCSELGRIVLGNASTLSC